jgi:hypothetical protein
MEIKGSACGLSDLSQEFVDIPPKMIFSTLKEYKNLSMRI